MRHKYYTISEDQINTLRELINIIIKLDNQLYKRRLERNPKRGKYTSQGRPQFDRQPRNYQSYGEPMEFDVTKPRLGQERIKKRWKTSFWKKKEIKYYDCGKIGHIKWNYWQQQQ